MKQYKLLILDLDGTTVASKQDALPSEAVVSAISNAKRTIKVAIASGRPFPLAKPVIDALGLSGIGVFNGGAEIIDMQTGEIKSKQMIPAETMKELFTICAPFGYNLYTDADEYSTVLKNSEDVTSSAAKFFIEEVATKDVIAMLEELTAVKGISAHPTSSWGEGDVVDIHVTHEHGTKRYGVERLIEMLGLATEDVIAIGDSHNDLPLLEAVGLKIAMGNAPKEIKQVADFVTTDLEEDGVAVAINKFVLGE